MAQGRASSLIPSLFIPLPIRSSFLIQSQDIWSRLRSREYASLWDLSLSPSFIIFHLAIVMARPNKSGPTQGQAKRSQDGLLMTLAQRQIASLQAWMHRATDWNVHYHRKSSYDTRATVPSMGCCWSRNLDAMGYVWFIN